MWIELDCVLHLCLFHCGCVDGNGRDGMLFAHAQIALGRIPEQVLQRVWIHLQAIQLLRSFDRRNEERVIIIHLNQII